MNISAGKLMTSNALTVDVEDYFQVSALAPYVNRSDWGSIACRVEGNIDRLLTAFDKHEIKATFFTLGWIAQRFPEMVRRIVAGGHELASHGYAHLRASDQKREDFFSDISLAKDILENVAGVRILGYRAPSFSIGRENLWAFDCLKEAGYIYSSSVYPVQHDHYGMVEAPRFPYTPIDGILGLPITTIQLFGRNIPVGGGGYFRLVPYAVSRWAIERFNRLESKPAIFYMHPWEIDPNQPRVPGMDWKSRFRHCVNLEKTEERLLRLLDDFNWDRVDKVFEVLKPGALPKSTASNTSATAP